MRPSDSGRSSAAPRGHLDGYAQFYASKIWNDLAASDCSVTYYKEFLWHDPAAVCPSGNECVPFTTPEHGTLLSILPPVAVSCQEPFARAGSTATGWRNNFCPICDAAELVTEMDIMGFLWNLNDDAPGVRSSMEDIFAIYRHACHPDDVVPANRVVADIGWEPIRNDTGQLARPGFVEGAELRFDMADLRFDHVVLVGKLFGVTPELAP